MVFSDHTETEETMAAFDPDSADFKASLSPADLKFGRKCEQDGRHDWIGVGEVVVCARGGELAVPALAGV